MAKLYLIYPMSPEDRNSNGWNAALVDAADAAAARTAALANKPDGETDAGRVGRWAASEVAGTAGSLPNGAAVMWLDGVKDLGAARAI